MLRIRQTDDLDAVVELNKEIFPTTGVIEQDDLDQSVWWVAEFMPDTPNVGWMPVGFAGVRIQPGKFGKGTKAFMTRAGVLPQFRGAGIQQRLIRARVSYARAHCAAYIYTYVWSLNIASMRSLVKCGFVPYYGERSLVGATTYQTFVYLKRVLTSKKALPKAA